MDFSSLADDAERRIQYVLGVATAEVNVDAEARAFFCLGQLCALQGKNAQALNAFWRTIAADHPKPVT